MTSEISIDGIINFLLGLVVSLMGLFMKGQGDRIKSLEEAHEKFVDTYARKDDMRADFALIRTQLTRMEDKLDKKYG